MFSLNTLVACLVVLLNFSTTSAGPAFSRGSAVFAVSRGGGLFGGKDDLTSTDTSAPATTEDQKQYPAMNREEIEAWLDHVPVFAVTDDKGQGVVLRPDSDTSVFYFFLSSTMANATLNQLKESDAESTDLRVSAFSLGKVWFNILENDEDREVILKPPGSDEGTPANNVEYRLVPDTRDLLGARMLLTMNPEDGEKLKQGGEMTPEIAQAAIKKAMTESPKFNTTYNEIPVFVISQMRMQKAPVEGEEGEPVTLMPMYFSLQNMVSTWQQFMKQAPSEMQSVEPAINLMSLHDMVGLMQSESPLDFRNVVLIPSVPADEDGGSVAAAAGTPTVENPMNSMGGSTLGDL